MSPVKHLLTRFQLDISSFLMMGQPLPILLDLFYYFPNKTAGALCMLYEHAIRHLISLALETCVDVRYPYFFY
jgi:hypothetical protein